MIEGQHQLTFCFRNLHLWQASATRALFLTVFVHDPVSRAGSAAPFLFDRVAETIRMVECVRDDAERTEWPLMGSVGPPD